MLHVLKEQTRFRGGSVDLTHLNSYIRKNNDYDAHKQMPIPGPYVKHVTPPEQHLTRLEDIDVTWLEKYVTNVLIGYKLNTGGVGEVRHRSNTNGTWTDSEGESRQITELDVDKDATYGNDISYAKSKLPYLLKRVHQKSVALGCSLISLYGRYLCVQRLENKATPKPQDILSVPIWQMSPQGSITKPYPQSANHNKGFPQAFAFVRGDFPNDPYYRDLVELGRVCELLGIQLWMEDPREFDQEFINSITVTYIQNNRDFLWNGRHVDSTVLAALSATSVADWNSERVRETESKFDSFTALLSIPEDWEAFPEEDVKLFLNMYGAYTGDEAFKGKYRRLPTCNGFVCAPDSDTPFLFDTTSMGAKGEKAVLHMSGRLIRYSSVSNTPFITVRTAIEYIRGAFGFKVKFSYPVGWGVWNYQEL